MYTYELCMYVHTSYFYMQITFTTGLTTLALSCVTKRHVATRSPHSLDAAEELKKLSRDQYNLAELQKKPLPEGVDPKELESYLSEEEFNVLSTQSCSCIVCGYCKFDCVHFHGEVTNYC